MTLAKGLSGGVMPIVRTLHARRLERRLREGPAAAHLHLRRQSLACAAALAALDVLVEDDLAAMRVHAAPSCSRGAREIAARYTDAIAEVPV